MAVFCTVTGSGAWKEFCADSAKKLVSKEMGVDGINAGGPEKGKEGRSTGTVLSVGEAWTAGEKGPKGPPGKDWVLTA